MDIHKLKELLALQSTTLLEYRHYEIDEPKPGEIIHWGELNPIKKLPDDLPDLDVLFIRSGYMSGSDYSGTTVELSNFQVFKGEYGEHPGIHEITGGYSSFGIAISVKWLLLADDEITDQIFETLTHLDDYPLIDDEHLSNMESEKEYEWVIGDGWKYDGAREFTKQTGIELVDPTDDQIWELYRHLSEVTNTYPLFEDNGAPWIDWERIVKGYKIGDLTRLDIPHVLAEVE